MQVIFSKTLGHGTGKIWHKHKFWKETNGSQVKIPFLSKEAGLQSDKSLQALARICKVLKD